MKLIKNAQARSLIRTVAKVAGTALVSFGVLEQGQVDAVVDGVVQLGGALLVLWGVWESFKDKQDNPPSE